ncbi:MAG: signal peptidase I [Anaerolineales bacterium]|nr:signal peptidase I [Anaerolineales bacterium]
MTVEFDSLTTENEENIPEKPNLLGVLIDILETLLLSVVLFFLINAVSARIRIDGSSMEPNLHHGEFVIVSKINYRFGEPERGDVVVFDFPRNITQEYIKRIIGLPGEHILVEDGKVYVNEIMLSEPYLIMEPQYEGEWVVPEDTLFVLGDNRNNSSDSHTWGMVPMNNVIGEALVVYWPPSSWGLINGTNPVLASD